MAQAIATELSERSSGWTQSTEFGSPRGVAREPDLPAFDPFRVLTPEERRRDLDAYLRILQARDGEIDFERRTLSKKEDLVSHFEATPARANGIDAKAFLQQLAGRSTRRPDARTRWLAALAKSNEAESYGVEGEVARILSGPWSHVDVRELYVLLEEQYHTRMLKEACRTCGVAEDLPPPPRAMRVLIVAMQYLPASIRYIPIISGEILGTVVFGLLLERCDRFADHPEAEARLRALLEQIWIDETFHVIYCRARLGPFAIRAARIISPLVARVMLRAVPQILGLGLDRRGFMRRFRSAVPIPPGIAWNEAERGRGNHVPGSRSRSTSSRRHW